MKFFPRIYKTPEGLTCWCTGCGHHIEAKSALSLTGSILAHLREFHHDTWLKSAPDSVAAAILNALRAA